jgi:hypothetical protein
MDDADNQSVEAKDDKGGPGKKDLAYSGKAIGMHTDNAYRYPTPDYQLLHAIEVWCDSSAM